MARTSYPDTSRLDVPIDRWTAPFWAATAAGELRLPSCASCGRYRWPPGPFCPACHSQDLVWTLAREGCIYAYTIVPSGPDRTDVTAPALIEFADAPGVRITAAIVDSEVEALRIGAPLDLDFTPAMNVSVPVFRVRT